MLRGNRPAPVVFFQPWGPFVGSPTLGYYREIYSLLIFVSLDLRVFSP